MREISVFVLLDDGREHEITIPLGISMSLMEALKAHEEPIDATCGGMALCASCHIQVVGGLDKTGGMTGDEEAMLDTLPDCTGTCRLSCQIKVSEALDGIRIRYMQPILV